MNDSSVESCTIVVHFLLVYNFIRSQNSAKLPGTIVATPGGGGIIPKNTVMSGVSIPVIKVKLRTIIRVNPCRAKTSCSTIRYSGS